MRSTKLRKDQLSHALETIERNARSQSQLIDDLLDVSRIITNKLQIEYLAVDLSSIIEAAIDSVRPALEAKEILLETCIESGAPVLGDATRLQQIFWNLFSNAVKFTPKGGQIKITGERWGAGIRVSVIDTGIGIDSEFQPFIFDRFRQADGSTTRQHGGLGLGLAIVRHLVELHRGSIEVSSEGKDRGATFTVSLPIASIANMVNVHNDQLLYLEGDNSTTGSGLLDGLRILVVDDEADARDLVSAILTRCGSEVRCSESVAEAIQVFREWDPDLLVSDIGMPHEDGYSLIKKVRKLRSKGAKQIPALALTAYATDEDRSRALSAGFQAHLSKPIEPVVLITSIATALGRGPSAK